MVRRHDRVHERRQSSRLYISFWHHFVVAEALFGAPEFSSARHTAAGEYRRTAKGRGTYRYSIARSTTPFAGMRRCVRPNVRAKTSDERRCELWCQRCQQMAVHRRGVGRIVREVSLQSKTVGCCGGYPGFCRTPLEKIVALAKAPRRHCVDNRFGWRNSRRDSGSTEFFGRSAGLRKVLSRSICPWVSRFDAGYGVLVQGRKAQHQYGPARILRYRLARPARQRFLRQFRICS